MSDKPKHPLLTWADRKGWTIGDIAEAAECSEWHIRNICAGRKDASLKLAKRLSEVSGGKVPMDAFLKTAVLEARA
jgi:plasmid maintenance system antidote protein VapI